MTIRPRLFCLKLVHVALLSLWMTSTAAAECGYFKPLGDLTAQMRLVATGQGSLGTATARRVALQVQDVELREVRRRLLAMNIFAKVNQIEQLVESATEYSQTVYTADTAELMRNVRYMEGLFKVICSSLLEEEPIRNDKVSNRNGYLTSLNENYRDYVKVGLVVVFLAGVVGLLLLLHYATLRIIGMVQHKKFCRVSAQICGDNQVFLGKVTRAGLNGVRFEFENDAEAKRLTNLMASPGFVYFDLKIDEKSWPVFVDKFQIFFVPLYFLKRLKTNELGKILAKSTRATHHAPAIGHLSNRRLWRAEIKERKAKIRNATRQRVVSQ